MTKVLATVKCRATYRWWSFLNWRKGYQFRPIQRFRCCEHTTPYHYRWCDHSDGDQRG